MPGVSVTVGGNFGKLDELDSKAAKVAKRIKEGFEFRIGQRMFDGLSRAASRIPGMVSAALEAASDMGEVVSKNNEVFQSSSESMLAWAANSATAFGQSKAAALAAASDYGNLFRAMDIAPDKAAAMSQSMVELAADLASFNNTTVEEAVTAIGAALRGEAEPIRRYGVLLNDATLKAEAFSQGLSDGKKTLDPTTKALAAYNLILSKTGTAQGDFARTSDGAANSSRIIKAQVADAAAEFGRSFLPAVEDVAAKIKSVDWEGLANGLASLVRASIALVPTIKAIGVAMVALKIGTYVSSIIEKVKATYAAAAAARAEAAAMGQASAATAAKTATDKAATAASTAKATAAVGGMARTGVAMKTLSRGFKALYLSIGPIGWAILLATVAMDQFNRMIARSKEETDALEESVDRGNKALQKFNAQKLRGEVASQEDIAKKLEELEAEKEAIWEAAEAQMDNLSDGAAEKVAKDTEMTIKLLDQQGDRLRKTSQAQLDANRAKREAEAAERAYAEALRETAKNLEEAQKSFDQALASREKIRFDALGIEEKIEELNKAEQKIREGFNFAIRINLGDASAEELQKEFAQFPNVIGRDKDMEAATELLKIETKRAELQKDLEKKRAEGREFVANYDRELDALNAQIDGNETKLAQLQREALIRQKIVDLEKAGLGSKEAESRAIAFADAKDKLAAKEKLQPAAEAGDEARKALAGKEEAIGFRIAELVERGLTEGQAAKTAELESLTEKRTDLDSRIESSSDNQAIVTGSQGRIGGGGGVYVAGLDYQRQIADLNREQLMVSKQIAEHLANNRMFD